MGVLYGGGVALVALVAVAVVLRLWHMSPGIPITGYAGDADLNNAAVKDVLEHGWYQHNPDVGAPAGQTLYDFSAFSGDNLQVLAIKLIGYGVGSWGATLNVFFLLSFPLVALSALLCLRRLGLSRPSAAAAAILFTFLPYHFIRGLNGHLFLSAYYSVPLGCYLALAVLLHRPIFESAPASRHRLVALATSRTSLLTFAFCVVIGSCGVYYAAFTILLLLLAALLVRRRGAAVAGVAAAALIGVVALANLAPNIVYRFQHGPNTQVAQRLAVESEQYATKLTDLVLPLTGDRIPPLAHAKAYYAATAPAPPDFGVSLGLLGSIGLAVLFIAALLAAVAAGRGVDRRLAAAGTLAIFGFVVITTGGISSLIGYFVSPQIRAWYRESIFLGFLALLGVGIVLDALGRRLGARRMMPTLLALAAIATAFGLFEQTTDAFIPQYAVVQAEWKSDTAYVAALERRLPKGAEILQLPYVAFPESGSVGSVGVYAQSHGYLHSDDLRWSWGAMKGRSTEWEAAQVGKGVPPFVAAAAAIGFDGVEVDRGGYPQDSPRLEATLRQLLGVEPLVSADERLVFFDLRPFARSLRHRLSTARLARLRAAILHPIVTDWTKGFYDTQQTSTTAWHWTGLASPELVLDNQLGHPQSLRFRSSVRLPASDSGTLAVRWPDGKTETVALRGGAGRLDHTFTLPPGKARVSFETTASPVPDATGRIVTFGLTNTSLDPPGVSLPPLSAAIPTVDYGSGWFPVEEAGVDASRWMGTRGALVVRTPRAQAAVVRLSLYSLDVPRRLSVRLGGRTLATLDVPANRYAAFRISVPARPRTHEIVLEATPPARRAGTGDPRQVSVALRALSVADS